MLQFFLELTIALLAVYGAYSALHEIVALLERMVGSEPSPKQADPRNGQTQGKEVSHGESGESRESGRSDHVGRDD